MTIPKLDTPTQNVNRQRDNNGCYVFSPDEFNTYTFDEIEKEPFHMVIITLSSGVSIYDMKTYQINKHIYTSKKLQK